MANLNITDLDPELMNEAITNAQARRNNYITEISEKEAAEVLGGVSWRLVFLGLIFDL